MTDGVATDSMRERSPSPSPEEERFWRAASPLLARTGVTRSTMMGFPCIRADEKFLASYDRATGDLLVKLPADRVAHLIANGQGRAFAPARRQFREWVAISPARESLWPAFLDEALSFVAASD